MAKSPYGRIGNFIVGSPKLDAKDISILKVFTENSRSALSKIRSAVSLSRDGIDYRIKQLIDKNVILKFLPIISTRKLGYNSFHVFFLLDSRNRKEKQLFMDKLMHHPNVRSVIEYSGKWDIEALFIVRDVIEFDYLLTHFITDFSDIISDKMKLEVIHYYKSILYPMDVLKTRIKERYPSLDYDVDEEDIKIISLLSENGRSSTYKIASKLNISPDKVAYRIKQMYRSGLIEYFGMVLNLSALGYQWYTCAMNFKVLDKKNEFKFKEYVKKNPFIIRAVKILGKWDVMLYLLANDSGDLHSTMKEIREEFSNIISSYEIWSAYKEHTYVHIPQDIKSHIKRKKVLVFGTFDVLHPGHLKLFKDAKKHGDHLTVVVARDVTVSKVKNQKPKYEEKDRLDHVRQISIVDSAILGDQKDKYKIIKEVNPDVICLGYDQTTFTDKLELKLDEYAIQAEIVRMKPYKEKKYKSSKMKD